MATDPVIGRRYPRGDLFRAARVSPRVAAAPAAALASVGTAALDVGEGILSRAAQAEDSAQQARGLADYQRLLNATAMQIEQDRNPETALERLEAADEAIAAQVSSTLTRENARAGFENARAGMRSSAMQNMLKVSHQQSIGKASAEGLTALDSMAVAAQDMSADGLNAVTEQQAALVASQVEAGVWTPEFGRQTLNRVNDETRGNWYRVLAINEPNRAADMVAADPHLSPGVARSVEVSARSRAETLDLRARSLALQEENRRMRLEDRAWRDQQRALKEAQDDQTARLMQLSLSDPQAAMAQADELVGSQDIRFAQRNTIYQMAKDNLAGVDFPSNQAVLNDLHQQMVESPMDLTTDYIQGLYGPNSLNRDDVSRETLRLGSAQRQWQSAERQQRARDLRVLQSYAASKRPQGYTYNPLLKARYDAAVNDVSVAYSGLFGGEHAGDNEWARAQIDLAAQSNTIPVDAVTASGDSARDKMAALENEALAALAENDTARAETLRAQAIAIGEQAIGAKAERVRPPKPPEVKPVPVGAYTVPEPTTANVEYYRIQRRQPTVGDWFRKQAALAESGERGTVEYWKKRAE